MLKICLFATGCAGIVAEFVLSTLATYLIGNAVFQWTIVMSLMLFAMGIGSRVSRWFHSELLEWFICVEFALSILCALSAETAYGLAAHTSYISLLIYALAVMVGCLIGLEIPLVTRLNQSYEELRINISGVMEKDYYGALVGGLVFAFVALPYLGLTYTPILLGAVNFLVASSVLWKCFSLVSHKRLLVGFFGVTLVCLGLIGYFAGPIIRYGEQIKYKDKIIYSAQSAYQKIVVTRWKNDYWLYINGQEQFSTFDEEKYHEPLVHPAMKLSHDAGQVLIIGGGDGLALREVLKHENVEAVTLVDLDPAMTRLAAEHPVLTTINGGSMVGPKVKIVNEDAAKFVRRDVNFYGVIIIDLPDPDSVDLMHVYSESFYRMLRNHLIRGGVMVAQATSPYFSRDAFLCILKTIGAAGFSAVPYHNQIPTMGEWGWVLGVRKEDAGTETIRTALMNEPFSGINTRFLNRDAMISMLFFGKGVLDAAHMNAIRVNSEANPVLTRYYRGGSWGVY